MANERLTLEIVSKAIGQDSIDQLSGSLDRFSAAAESAGKRSGTGLKSIQPAADEASGSLRRLFLAAKDLGEGRKGFAIVEAGYFIQSLSGVALAAGTAAGAIGALGYALYYFQNKVGPLAQAQKELAESNKALDTSYADLGKRLERLNIETLTAEFGKAKGGQLAAFYGESDLAGDKARIGYLADLIERTKKTIAGETARTSNPFIATLEAFNPFITGMKLANNRDAAAQAKNIEKYQGELDFLRAKTTVDQRQIDSELARVKKEESEPIARHQSAALLGSRELLFRSAFEPNAGRDLRGQLERATSFTNDQGQIQHLKLQDETRRNLEAAFHAYALDLNKKASDEAIKNITEEFRAATQFDWERSEKLRSYLTGTSSIELGTLDKIFGHQNILLGYGRDSSLQASEFLGIGPAHTLRPRGMDADEQARQRDAADARMALGQISRRRDINAGYLTGTAINEAADIERAQQASLIGVAQALKAGNIDAGAAQGRYRAIYGQSAQQGTELNDKYAADLLKTQQDAVTDATRVIKELENKQIDRIQALIDKQTESAVAFSAGLFDAAISRSPNAIPNFLKSEVLSLGRTMIGNVTRDYIYPAVKSVIPKSDNPIFKNTPFEKDPLKISAAPALTTAAQELGTSAGELTAAARALSASPTGAGGGRLAAASGGSNVGGIAMASGYPSPSAASDAPGDSGWDIYSQAGVDPTYKGTQLSTSPPSSFGLNAGTLTKIAAAGAGAYAAFSDFRSGGVKNDIAGAGAGLGSAAAIAAMIPGGQLVALGLGIASAATSLISAILPDPHVQRANAIYNEVSQAQYLAPTALNVTQSANGNFADFDARGNLRTSNFSAVPMVAQPFIWQQTHGLFGGQPTYYDVPGGQTSQFGPVAPPAPAVTVNVNAIDTQTGVDFLMKNHMAVGDATARAMQRAHGSLTNEVQRAAGR
jgi:hypothetical protein